MPASSVDWLPSRPQVRFRSRQAREPMSKAENSRTAGGRAGHAGRHDRLRRCRCDLARALLRGGIGAMEVTLRTPAALARSQRSRTKFPISLSRRHGALAHGSDAAGAAGATSRSPRFHARAAHRRTKSGIPYLPASRRPARSRWGLTRLLLFKFFPAGGAGGSRRSAHSPRPSAAPLLRDRRHHRGHRAVIPRSAERTVRGRIVDSAHRPVARREWSAIETRARATRRLLQAQATR